MIYNRGYYTEAYPKKEIMGLLATVASLPSLTTAHDFFFQVGFGNILIWLPSALMFIHEPSRLVRLWINMNKKPFMSTHKGTHVKR